MFSLFDIRTELDTWDVKTKARWQGGGSQQQEFEGSYLGHFEHSAIPLPIAIDWQ